MEKITQTAGRNQLGDFAPDFGITTTMYCSGRTGIIRTLT